MNIIKKIFGISRVFPMIKLLLDDTERSYYIDGFQELEKLGFREISFEGINPNSCDKLWKIH
jgi:hypothetical protein